MAANTYYVMVMRSESDGFWYPQFGDFDKEVVKDEIENEKDSGCLSKGIKMISCAPHQKNIDAAVKELNHA